MDPRLDAAMVPLLAGARASGHWLFSPYQHLWFSPDALAKAQAAGNFRWGPTNWELRDPQERLRQLHTEVETRRAEIASIERELSDTT